MSVEAFRALELQLTLARFLETEEALKMCETMTEPDSLLSPQQRIDVLESTLLDGAPYYWSPPLCDLLEEVARDLPTHWKPHPDAFPTPAGFFYFARPYPRPLAVSGPNGAIPFEALPPSVQAMADPSGTIPTELRGLSWLQFSGDAAWVSAWMQTATNPVTLPEYLWLWRYDLSIAEHDAKLGTSPFARGVVDILRLLASGLTLLEQRILVTARTMGTRPIRRRAAAAGQPPPVVDVVTLRRTMQVHHGTGEDAPEWSCQWIVRGHWRDHWHPKLQEHRPRWILPHVKGPEDKPLRAPSTKLFAVTR